MRLAILTSHPIQYNAFWFRHLAESGPCDVEVLYMHRQDAKGQAAAGFGVEFEWDVPLLDGYAHRFLENVAKEPSVSTFAGCDTPEIYDLAADYDAMLIFGWNRKAALQAAHACRRAGIPVLMRGDSQLQTRRSALMSIAKYPAYRAGLPQIDGHLYVGSRNRDYLEHYGVGEDRLFYTPHFVDNGFFARRAEMARASGEAAQIRRDLGIPDDAFVPLLVGKFIEKKRAADFAQALGLVRSFHNVQGLFVGDGPLRASVEAAAPERAHFAGFRNQSELPAYYAAADALVLPSDGRETWGLVANEAMACGLPVVVSEPAGCAPDLVVEGQTGFTFPVGDAYALARRLEDLADLVTTSPHAVQHAVSRKIGTHDVHAATLGLEAALRATVLRAGRPADGMQPVSRAA